MERYDAIVIGAGIAGLVAARDLRVAGRSVLVLEARERLGGRTWYREFADTSQKVEIGGTWFAGRYQPHIQREIHRYGLTVSASPAGKSFRSGVGGAVLDGVCPVPLEQVVDLERGLFHVIAAARRLRFGEPLDTQGLDDLDVSFEQFLAGIELGRETREYLQSWGGFFFGCHPSEVSALHVLSWVAGFDNSAWAWYAAISDKLATGTAGLVAALAEEAGADVAHGAAVASVEQTADGVRVTTRAGDVHEARAAVLATPLNTWTGIRFEPALSVAKAAAAAERQTGHSVKIWALAENVPENLIAVGWGGGLNWISEEFRLPEGALLVGFGTSPEMLDVMSRYDIERAIRQYAPEARVIASDAHDWNQDEFAGGTWMAYRPGQLVRFHSAFQEPEGRLAFAGSDLALGWAGWMDGAIESASRAAGQVERMLAPGA